MSLLKAFMMEKPNIMYATIKGTLTENDGVFSGFSTTSYLTLSTIDLSNSFEILLKVKTPSIWGTDSGIIINSNYSNANRFIVQKDSSNKRFQYRIPTYNQSGYTNYYSPTTILEDTYYYIKFVFNGSSLVVSRSTDNTNWEIDVNISRSQGLPSNAYTLGRNANLEQQQWGGSIDLNRSYIKLGSTKYNLQAVVGYTVVGSPTITDGVVSGFTTSDYIYIPNFPYTKNWSITTKANTTATGATQRCLYRSVNFQLRVNTINIWEIYASGVNKSLGQSPTSYPYVRVEKENGYISAYISQDGKTYSKVAENIDAGSVTDGSLSFSSNGAIWSGSIDMNETIIFVNNKLYFNGQQA